METSRRGFLSLTTAAGAGFALRPRLRWGRRRLPGPAPFGFPDPARHWRGDSSVAAAMRASGSGVAPTAAQRPPRDQAPPDQTPRAPGLADRFPDLPRHFVFEYYPWYATMPYGHWNEADRHPPVDIASNYMPKLGAYDSRSTEVMAQHARWIKQAGAGAIAISWWGRGSDIDQLVPSLMDVMADHDIHVTFALEPYIDQHAQNYARDLQYLITEYGDRRRWDCFLLVRDADGRIGPVFKSFRTILPQQITDCHGVPADVPDYAPDGVWRRQTDLVRNGFARDFDRLILLADSLALDRTQAAGFDGIGIYDNFVKPSTWRGWARECSSRGLLFSFNTNPGFDAVGLRQFDPSSCYRPAAFEPGGASYDWALGADRLSAQVASADRVKESFSTTLALQTDPALTNAARGFLLVYINSFNEWHEGHQFEPMKDRGELTPAERAIGYHNADEGAYRMRLLSSLVGQVLEN